MPGFFPPKSAVLSSAQDEGSWEEGEGSYLSFGFGTGLAENGSGCCLKTCIKDSQVSIEFESLTSVAAASAQL